MEIDAHAATGHGDEFGRHEVGRQQEHGVARRLLQGLQQHGGGQPGQVEVGDDDHLAPPLEGPALGQAHHPAGVGHRQGRPRTVDLDQVGMDPGQGAPARRTHAAPPVGAEHGGGEPAHERLLTHTGGTHQQVGVHGPAGRGPQLGHGGVLAHHRVEEGRHRALVRRHRHRPRVPRPARVGRRATVCRHGAPMGSGPRRASTAVLTARATSSVSAAPSTTTQRSGSAAARAR